VTVYTHFRESTCPKLLARWAANWEKFGWTVRIVLQNRPVPPGALFCPVTLFNAGVKPPRKKPRKLHKAWLVPWQEICSR
jgi:hypothetical protein